MFEVLLEILAEKSSAKKASTAAAKSSLHVVPGAKPVTAEVLYFVIFCTFIF